MYFNPINSLSNLPKNAKEEDIYFNTDNNKFYKFINGIWTVFILTHISKYNVICNLCSHSFIYHYKVNNYGCSYCGCSEKTCPSDYIQTENIQKTINIAEQSKLLKWLRKL
jgi:hypothetical protein